MKKFTSEQFDEFIRNKLYNYEQEPPADVYYSLKKNMPASNGLQLWHIFSIGISGIILFFTAYFFLPYNQQTTTNQPSIVENKQTNPSPSETYVNSTQPSNRSKKHRRKQKTYLLLRLQKGSYLAMTINLQAQLSRFYKTHCKITTIHK